MSGLQILKYRKKYIKANALLNMLYSIQLPNTKQSGNFYYTIYPKFIFSKLQHDVTIHALRNTVNHYYHLIDAFAIKFIKTKTG